MLGWVLEGWTYGVEAVRVGERVVVAFVEFQALGTVVGCAYRWCVIIRDLRYTRTWHRALS